MMKLRLFVLLWVTVLGSLNLAIPSSMSYAQGGDTQTATADDGRLSFAYPADWLQTSDAINSVVVADGNASLAAFENGGEMTGLALAATSLQRLEVETDLDFQSTNADEFLAEYQELYDVFAIDATHFAAFDFRAYQQVIYAVDYADDVYLFFAYTDDVTQHETQLIAIIESIEFAPISSPIPTDLVPVDNIVPQAGEYMGIVVDQDCPTTSYEPTVYLELAEINLQDNQLHIGTENPLIYTRTETGIYTNEAGDDTWTIISDEIFLREIIVPDKCARIEQYFTHTPTPASHELAEDSVFALPLSNKRYMHVSVADCPSTQVTETPVYLAYALVEDNRLRVRQTKTEQGIMADQSMHTVLYYESTSDTGTYQRSDIASVTTIQLASSNFFTTIEETNECTVWSSYLLDEILDNTLTDIVGLDPDVLDTTTETGLNTQLFFDGKLIVAYSDVFNDSYLPPNDLAFTLSADGANGDLEIFMATAEEIANNFSGDIATMTLEQFATSDKNTSAYGSVISDIETVEGTFHPTVTRAYQQGEERRLTFYFMDIPDVGKLFVKVTTPLEGWADWEAIVLEVLNSINNPTIVDLPIPPSFEVVTEAGIVFTPDNSSYDLKINALGGNPMLEIRHDEGYLITIRFDTGFESGTYDIQGTDPRMVNRTPFGMLNLPTTVKKPNSNENLSAIYGSSSRGTLTLENDGLTISATFEVTSSFSQFMTFGDQPERHATLPETVSFSGSFSNIPLASLEQ